MGVTPSTSLNSEYGKVYTVASRYYPYIFADEKTGYVDTKYGTLLGPSNQTKWYSGYAQASTLKGEWTYYNYTLSSYKATSTVQHALTTGQPNSTGSTSHTTYWLASRCIDYGLSPRGDTTFVFRQFCVSGGTMTAINLYLSYDSWNNPSYLVRPCVEIDLSKANIGITGTGTNTDPYSITAR